VHGVAGKAEDIAARQQRPAKRLIGIKLLAMLIKEHDPELIGAADRVVRLVDGRIVEPPVRDDGPRPTLPALAGMR
jgi:hypothetical protein